MTRGVSLSEHISQACSAILVLAAVIIVIAGLSLLVVMGLGTWGGRHAVNRPAHLQCKSGAGQQAVGALAGGAAGAGLKRASVRFIQDGAV